MQCTLGSKNINIRQMLFHFDWIYQGYLDPYLKKTSVGVVKLCVTVRPWFQNTLV